MKLSMFPQRLSPPCRLGWLFQTIPPAIFGFVFSVGHRPSNWVRSVKPPSRHRIRRSCCETAAQQSKTGFVPFVGQNHPCPHAYLQNGFALSTTAPRVPARHPRNGALRFRVLAWRLSLDKMTKGDPVDRIRYQAGRYQGQLNAKRDHPLPIDHSGGGRPSGRTIGQPVSRDYGIKRLPQFS